MLDDALLLEVVEELNRRFTRKSYEKLLVDLDLISLSTLKDNDEASRLTKYDLILETLRSIQYQYKIIYGLYKRHLLSKELYNRLVQAGIDFGEVTTQSIKVQPTASSKNEPIAVDEIVATSVGRVKRAEDGSGSKESAARGSNPNPSRLTKAQIISIVIPITVALIGLVGVLITNWDKIKGSVQENEYVGRVIDSNSQQPIIGAKVSLDFQGAPLIVYTDSEGVYRFIVAIDSSLSSQVRVDAVGYEVYRRNITISPEPQTLEDIRLTSLTDTFSSGLSPGTTIQHRVAVGEWLLQIVRCYGADLATVRNANPQIIDHYSNTDLLPGIVVIVPDIGKVGRIYGPPCVTFASVRSGDTWTSIAQIYNADVAILQMVNPSGLLPGMMIKVPLNSAVPVSFTLQDGPLQEQATLSPKEMLNYQFRVTEGERLTIDLQNASNGIALNISGAGLTLSSSNLAQAWNIVTPAEGTYTISVANTLGSDEAAYKLVVHRLAVAITPVVVTVTAGTSGTIDERIARVTKAIGEYTMANIAYNVPPETMQLDETLIMELLLNPSVDPEVLASQIDESGHIQTANIQITDQMKAELIQEAEGFTIRPFRDDPEQPIGQTQSTKWSWYVTANIPGRHKLTLIIYRLVLVNDEEQWIEAGIAYKSEINVMISPGQRISRLDWKWIATFILAFVGSILAVLTWLNNRKREQAEEDGTKKDKTTKKVKKGKK